MCACMWASEAGVAREANRIASHRMPFAVGGRILHDCGCLALQPPVCVWVRYLLAASIFPCTIVTIPRLLPVVTGLITGMHLLQTELYSERKIQVPNQKQSTCFLHHLWLLNSLGLRTCDTGIGHGSDKLFLAVTGAGRCVKCNVACVFRRRNPLAYRVHVRRQPGGSNNGGSPFCNMGRF
jgi:hypothetical protein